MIDNQQHFSVDLCSYYTAVEVEKVRTVNYILALSHDDRMIGAILLHSVAQVKARNYMNHPLIYSTNTNKI